MGVNVLETDMDVTPSRSREYHVQLIAGMLAGRVAERMFTKKLSAGASSDLKKATRLARDMVTRYGLVEDFSQNRVYMKDDQDNMLNEQTVTDIIRHMNEILEEARKYAESLLKEKRNYLQELAKALFENGMLSDGEITELFEKL